MLILLSWILYGALYPISNLSYWSLMKLEKPLQIHCFKDYLTDWCVLCTWFDSYSVRFSMSFCLTVKSVSLNLSADGVYSEKSAYENRVFRKIHSLNLPKSGALQLNLKCYCSSGCCVWTILWTSGRFHATRQPHNAHRCFCDQVLE